MSYDPNQAPGGGQWPAPGTPSGTPTGGTPADPVVYGHDQPTVPYGAPGGQTAWVPYQEPEVPTVEVAPPAKKGRGKIIGGVVGVAVLVAAGVFAFTAISGGHEGGAGSPEEAVEQLFDSVEQLDVLGTLDALLPGERDITSDRAQRLVADLTEIGVLSDDASLSKVDGVEITLSDMSYEPIETNVDDITDVLVSGSIDASVNGEELPIGDLVIDRFLGGDRPDIDESNSGEFEDVMLTTVEQDGRWYVSIGYTIAEYARTGSGHPEDARFDIPDAADAIALNGGDSPEGAINNLLDAVEGFDLEGIVGTLDPREVGALQRYAPLFIDDAADQFSDLQDQVALTFGDITYDVVQNGDEATVGFTIDSLHVDTPEGAIEYSSADQCITFTPNDGGDQMTQCADQLAGDPGDIAGQLEELLPDDPELVDQVTTTVEDAEDAFADVGPTGITVSKVDGKWYVSALGTVADSGLTVLDALDRQEFETLIDDVEALVSAFEDSSMGGEFEIPGG